MKEIVHLLGKIIDTPQERDCVHIAVVPTEAGDFLSPGDEVALHEGKAIYPWDDGEEIGIVDPYLKNGVEKGQRFWLFLFPGSITSLRHHWTHPAFPDPDSVKEEKEAQRSRDLTESVIWVRQYASLLGMSYVELMTAGDRYREIQRTHRVPVTEETDVNGAIDGISLFWGHYRKIRSVPSECILPESAPFFLEFPAGV